MAIAIDQPNAGTAADDNGGSSFGVSTTQAVASGGFIVASITWWHASATLSSVSGGGLTWAVAVQAKHGSNNANVGIAYAQAPSGLASSTTITANFSDTVFARGIAITSFTGVATSSPEDATATPVGSITSAWTTGNVSIEAGSVLFAACHFQGVSTSTITSPSIELVDVTDGANFSYTAGYRIEASSGTYAVAGTWSVGSTENVTVAAAFLAGTGPTDPPENTVAPVASGDALVSETVSCTTGTWDNEPDTFAYQWQRRIPE